MKNTSQMVYDRATSKCFEKSDFFFFFFQWAKNNKMLLPEDRANPAMWGGEGIFPDINPPPTFFDWFNVWII